MNTAEPYIQERSIILPILMGLCRGRTAKTTLIMEPGMQNAVIGKPSRLNHQLSSTIRVSHSVPLPAD